MRPFGGAGFYFDYSSLEEAFLGTTGQSAEMPNPGVQSQFIAQSGGNQFSGEYYLDWYNNSLQASNIPDNYIGRSPAAARLPQGRQRDRQVLRHGAERRRPDQQGQGVVVRHLPHAEERRGAADLPRFDKTFDTKLWNPIGKVTYQANQNNKIIGYYQWGQKLQPNRLPFATYTYTDEAQTNQQDSGSWVYKGEWNCTISDKLYLETRYGDFGYYFPLLGQRQRRLLLARHRRQEVLEGTHQQWQIDRQRKQITGAGDLLRRHRRAWARTPSSSAASSCGRSAGTATRSAGAATAS